MNEKEKKEYASLAIGFLLILFVITITLIRNNPFLEKTSQPAKEVLGMKKSNIPDEKMISAKDLQKKIITEEKSDFIILDIRPFEDYAQEHILDATNVALSEFPIASKIDTSKLVIIIGSNGEDENIAEAVEKIKAEKIKNYKVLIGGMDSWKKNAGATVSYGDPNKFVDQSKVSYVTQEDLKDALSQSTSMFILDVRTNEEYSRGHIPGAKNVPFEELEKRRKEITEKKAVVVGVNELQEFQASVQIHDMLFVSPFVLKGGMSQWEKNGYPVEK